LIREALLVMVRNAWMRMKRRRLVPSSSTAGIILGDSTPPRLGNQRKQDHGTTDSSKDSRKNQDRVEECSVVVLSFRRHACIATMNCN
jgi:hypothetical protein